jgi:nitrite reductase/ring-hydroxylating ferredoxin subunit/DMSO/TMAO reductase YedYZ heme-binding membrane subunit
VAVAYRAVQWTPHKRVYDRWLALGIALYLAAFWGTHALLHPDATLETALIRGLGTASFVLLHVVLSIGPLCRLDCRFLPLLYNRRHLGVAVFLLAATHALISLVQFHAGGDLPPLVSLLASNPRFDSLSQFPFQQLGLAALAILFLMAATSHDFWLANLTPPVWKALHMSVYAAYALLVGHVALGTLQAETHPLPAGALAAGALWLIAVHLAAALRERAAEAPHTGSGREQDGFVEVCRVEEIPENGARIAALGGERVAVFRYGGRISALSNVCQHQNGPLGEGRIIDGYVTCPWHGYQYRPDCGRAPEPYTERVPTFRARVRDGRVFVHPRPLPPGTYVPPSPTGEGRGDG